MADSVNDDQKLEGLGIDHAWGGTMGFTMDFVPSAGVMGQHKNIYYGVAYNGYGVVPGQTACRMVCDLVSGEKSELLDLFITNHTIPYAGPTNLMLPATRLYKWYLVRASSKTTH